MSDLDLGTVDADLYEIRDCYDPAMAGSRWTGQALRVADQLRAEVERQRTEVDDARHELEVLRGINTELSQRYEMAMDEWTAALKQRDQARDVVQHIRRLHSGPRTERHGSGCVQCAICWPCPTALAVGWRDGAYPPP